MWLSRPSLDLEFDAAKVDSDDEDGEDEDEDEDEELDANRNELLDPAETE